MIRVSSSALFSVFVLDHTHALVYADITLDQLSLATSFSSSKKHIGSHFCRQQIAPASAENRSYSESGGAYACPSLTFVKVKIN